MIVAAGACDCASDLQFAQAMDYPTVNAEINRDRAGQFGLNMSDVAQSLCSRYHIVSLHRTNLLAQSDVR
jgi:Cu/Ag efflux pump CusA